MWLFFQIRNRKLISVTGILQQFYITKVTWIFMNTKFKPNEITKLVKSNET